MVERRARILEVRGSNPGYCSNFSLEILHCKFPKAQIMSLFSINNFFPPQYLYICATLLFCFKKISVTVIKMLSDMKIDSNI